MSCTPTETLFETLTTTTTGDLTTFTTNSESSDVISGDFPSSLCAESANGSCIRSALSTLSFTYTTTATLPVTLTTNPAITTTQTIATGTLYGGCSDPPTPSSSSNNSNNDSSNTSNDSSSNTSNDSSRSSSNDNNSSNSNIGAIVGGAVGGTVALLILLAVIWVLWRRNLKMKRQLKAAGEEEKRQTMVNISDILPSPYVPPPGSSAAGLRSSYVPSDISPSPHPYIPPPSSYGGRTEDAAATAYSGVDFSPEHSRSGSRPQSSIVGGTIEPFTNAPSPSSPPPASSSNGPFPESVAASAKAREAYQHHSRAPLMPQNATETEDSDFIINTGAQGTAQLGPPPAYSPGEQPQPQP